jgi:putative endonuclease
MSHTYILLSKKTNKFYFDSTGNLQDRIIRHNSGRSKSTSSEIPWLFVYSKKFYSRRGAIRRKIEIKG